MGAGGSSLKEAAARGEPLQQQAPVENYSPLAGTHTGAEGLAGAATCGDPYWNSPF